MAARCLSYSRSESTVTAMSVQAAEDFLKQWGQDYRSLAKTVESTCKQLQARFGFEVIHDIYDRSKATRGTTEFKEPGKIIAKVRQQGAEPSNSEFFKLNDIIGLTMVIGYPRPVDEVIKALRDELSQQNVKTEEPERHLNKNGYYATHVICKKTVGGQPIRCEVQIKTMLHNAWSAKMHDLTYKPTGMLDGRLEALMASVAVTVESLEQQSQLIHDIIKAGWNVEEEAREAARQLVFERLLKTRGTKSNDEAVTLQSEIDKLVSEIAPKRNGGGTGTPDPKTIEDLRERVNKYQENPSNIRNVWVLAFKLLTIDKDPDFKKICKSYTDDWLKALSKLFQTTTTEQELEALEQDVLAVPLAYYIMADLDRAIECSDEILKIHGLRPELCGKIAFNKATFLIEREYHSPTKDPKRRKSLEAEIRDILNSTEVEALNRPAEKIDTLGLLKITFAGDKRQAREGIEEVLNARAKAPDDEKDVSNAYADLNVRLGWRRYFHLENQPDRT